MFFDIFCKITFLKILDDHTKTYIYTPIQFLFIWKCFATKWRRIQLFLQPWNINSFIQIDLEYSLSKHNFPFFFIINSHPFCFLCCLSLTRPPLSVEQTSLNASTEKRCNLIKEENCNDEFWSIVLNRHGPHIFSTNDHEQDKWYKRKIIRKRQEEGNKKFLL